jgi:hypothetical protein
MNIDRILLIIIIIYLIFSHFKKNKNREDFAFSDTDKNEIRGIIKDIYNTDMDAIRTLSDFAKKIQDGNNLNIPGNLTVSGTINGSVTGSSNSADKARYITEGIYSNGWKLYNNNGNIGIGTTSPSQLLDVNGTLKCNKILLSNDIWHLSHDNKLRFYFSNNHNTYYGTGENHVFRSKNDTDIMTITSNNYVGINTNDPKHPLHVAGSSPAWSGDIRGLWIPDGAFYTRGRSGNWDVGFFCEAVIRTNNYIINTSDKRIKKNIKDINGNDALLQIRKLQPKIYNHIDVRQVDGDIYGFIAQEVKDVISNSTVCTKDFIPNFYCFGNISIIDENNFIYKISSNNNLNFEKNLDNNKIKFFGFKNNEYICSLIKINNKKNINVKLEKKYIFSNSNEKKENIFIYGQEIDDFHNLEKSVIWTVATAALKEVDKQQQIDKEKIKELEEKNSKLEDKVLEQQLIINNILERLNKLELK